MNETPHHNQLPFDLDPFDAENALSNGQRQTLAVFLDETEGTLFRLSQAVAKAINEIEPSVSLSRGHSDEIIDEEWTGSTSQMVEAINADNRILISAYLLHLSKVIGRVGMLFKDDRSLSEPRIAKELKERKLGRPKKSRMQAMLEDSPTNMKLRFSNHKGTKQEAAIQEIVDQGGPSRAEVFRRKSRAKKEPLS